MTIEILLIILVMSIWIVSMLICFKHYSLYVCYHKKDLPF